MINAFPDIKNPKEHFVLHDGLLNLNGDVDFSVFKKYKCMAGCNMCYLQNDWLPEDKLQKYIPVQSAQKPYVDKLLNFFSHFSVITTIDDMRYLKDTHPQFFRFYQEYGSIFHLGSMSDNAIMRHLPIIENDINVHGVREISISEAFINKVNVSKLLNALDRIHRKAPICKINMILGSQSQSPEDSLAVKQWCESNKVLCQKQFEFGIEMEKSTSVLADLDNRRITNDGSFTESTAYSEQDEIFIIHSELVILMYDSLYFELKSVTREDRSNPFANLDGFDSVGFLPKVLEGKLKDYARYADMIQNKASTYYKYFQYLVDNLKINHDFNFIPAPLMTPHTKYFNQLTQSGKMVVSKYGLVKPGAVNIIPIIEFKNNEPNSI